MTEAIACGKTCLCLLPVDSIFFLEEKIILLLIIVAFISDFFAQKILLHWWLCLLILDIIFYDITMEESDMDSNRKYSHLLLFTLLKWNFSHLVVIHLITRVYAQRNNVLKCLLYKRKIIHWWLSYNLQFTYIRLFHVLLILF